MGSGEEEEEKNVNLFRSMREKSDVYDLVAEVMVPRIRVCAVLRVSKTSEKLYANSSRPRVLPTLT